MLQRKKTKKLTDEIVDQQALIQNDCKKLDRDGDDNIDPNCGAKKELTIMKQEATDKVDDNDDDLPAVLTPIKKNHKTGFKQGDLLFAKIQNWELWPAVFFSYVKKKKKSRRTTRCYVHFFEKLNDDIKKKKVFQVSLSNVKDFTCEDREKIIEEGIQKYGDQFKFGMNFAEDYLTKRGLGKIKEFFFEIEEETLSSSDEEIVNKEVPVNEIEGITKLSDNETEKPKAPACKYPLRRSKRRMSVECKGIVEWIVTSSQPLLFDIWYEKQISSRHHLFTKGSQKQKNHLKWSSGCGPLGDKEYEHLFELLVDWLKKLSPESRSCNAIEYVSEVWLPEAIIHGMAHSWRLSVEDAEQRFLG